MATFKLPVAGYMVLNRDGKTLWDGEVHRNLDRATGELRDAESDPKSNGTGWFIAELREVQPR